MFGGVITINSPDFTNDRTPFIAIYNCSFIQNMAYFSGNAIFIRNTNPISQLSNACGGVTFNYNYFS